MQNTSRTSIVDSDVVSAWQEQMATAVKALELLPEVMRHRDELFLRFAAHYARLRALPRRARRALQKQWRMPLAGVAFMLTLGQGPALAATIPVNASCTLVNALTAANTDTATGGCPAGSGPDTIVLPADSTQTLTQINNSTYGPTGLPVVSSAITIEGQGSRIARDGGAPEFRIMAVNSTGDLTLQETTVSGGVSPKVYNGGGVANYGGTLTITNSTIAGNGNSFVVVGSAGGVHNSGTFNMINSIISGNGNYNYFGSYGAGGVSNSGTFTMTASTIANNVTGWRGSAGGVDNSGTFNMINSLISDNGNDYGSAGGVSNSGTFSMIDSTISGNRTNTYHSFANAGGVSNSGTFSMTNSTISGNDTSSLRQYYGAGGVSNSGTFSMINSTISGNAARSDLGSNGAGAGGVENLGIFSMINSTILVNDASGHGSGGVWNEGTLTLAGTLLSGNIGGAPEIINFGTVVADNYNLFGFNGNAGVTGFSPGPKDIVPSVGMQLSNILNPVLAFKGGPTQTHALVPGSPAIDAGGTACTDANGNPLLTDQRGRPRIVDGNRDGTARCDIGAFEFFPVVNNLVTLASDLETSFDPTSVPGAPAGTFTINATFTNTSGTSLHFPFFGVSELSGGNLLLNADGSPGGVGATVTPNVGDRVLSPGEKVRVRFVIGLQARTPFTFFVDLFGEPLVSGASISRQRPSATTKTGRR
jgi:hypothetical protein